jgi:branched-chain amino acid transport system permease protein
MFFSILLLPKGLLGETSALALLRRHLGTAAKGGSAKNGVGWQ